MPGQDRAHTRSVQSYVPWPAGSHDAKLCLTAQHRTWAVGRDYTPCVGNLLRAAGDALRLRMKSIGAAEGGGNPLSILSEEPGMGTGPELGDYEDRRPVRNQEPVALPRQDSGGAGEEPGGGRPDRFCSGRSTECPGSMGQNKDFLAAELARFYDPALKVRWEQDAQHLLGWTKRTGRSAILVDKLEHRCYLLTAGRIEKSYVAIWAGTGIETRCRSTMLPRRRGNTR